ncbi:carbohydrate sulfotransferase 15-like [Babylonia areolata]|uniref:carbohydrate sulfotransferase 15-like n=1 Tax=Babylonia areolata TaxID=304850 RepID=UPI003FD19C6D
MVLKKKLPLAVVISMSTMLLMHVFMPINLHREGGGAGMGGGAGEGGDVTSQKKRNLLVHPLEDCPEEGELLPEDTPYWSHRVEEYKKPKYELDFVQDKPLSEVCCAPNTNLTQKTYGYIEPPVFEEKSKNPCWYNGTRLRCMPYFYIIGASKSATNDLFDRLRAHPNVQSTRKEVHWFSRLRTLGAGLRWYTNVFNSVARDIHHEITDAGSSNTVIGVMSSDYLSDVHVWEHFTGNQGCWEPRITVANHIRHVNPKAKVIINLRNPIQRVYSTYLYTAAARERLKDPSTQKLHEHVARAVPAYKECLKRLPVRACVYNRTLTKLHPVDIISGAYAPFVEDWMRTFGKDQVHVVRFEDYSKDMAATVKDIIAFLDLPPFSDSDFSQMKSIPKHQQNVYYRVGPIQNRTVKLLRDFYTPFNTRLAKILQDDRFLWK